MASKTILVTVKKAIKAMENIVKVIHFVIKRYFFYTAAVHIDFIFFWRERGEIKCEFGLKYHFCIDVEIYIAKYWNRLNNIHTIYSI